MKLLLPLLCAAATALCLAHSTVYAEPDAAHANFILDTTGLETTDLPISLAAPGSETGDLTLAQSRYQADLTQAMSTETAPKKHLALDNTTMSYRLAILGDLFTPGERAFLSNSSKLYSAARDMIKDSSSTRLDVSEEGSHGSAYSKAISKSLITAADPTGNVWGPLTSFSAANGGMRASMDNQIAPLVWDLSEQSRAASFSSATFIEKAVIFLPAGSASIASQVEMAEFKVGLQSLVSGKWPTFKHLEDVDYDHFCKVWLRRIANVAMANYVSTLLTPKNAGKAGETVAAKLRGAPPVTVNYRF